MAEIFTKQIRKKIKENTNILHSDIYIMLNRYCESNYHGDTKPYPEELTYVLSWGLEKVRSIQSCTNIHAMHIPLIIDAMDYAIDDLRTLMRKNYLPSEIENHLIYYLGSSVHILGSILKSIGLEHLYIQASDYINERTDLDFAWYDDNIYFPLTAKEQKEFQQSLIYSQPNHSYIDNIPYEYTKILNTAAAEEEISRKVESTHDDYISFKEIINRLGPSYSDGIIHIKNFLNDVADKTKFDHEIRDCLKESLRTKTAEIIESKKNPQPTPHTTNNNFYAPVGNFANQQHIDNLTTK